LQIPETDQPKKVKFAFSGKMARLLGRESVSNEVIALFELVKNAYDADSPKATVTFDKVDGENGRIIVRDYGEGMTENDILNKWLVIGTDSKEREKFTKHGRRVVGEKGIGRFATERLARKVTLISCPKDGSEVLELKINWDLYEARDARFDNVEHELTKRRRNESDRQGLEIILEGLRDRWTQKKIDALSEQFSGLVLPAALETNYPFTIELIAPDFQVTDTRIESNLLKKAPYRLKAILSDNQILISAWIKDEQVIGVNLDNHRIPNISMGCGPAILHYYAFPRDPSVKRGEREWEKYYGPLGSQLINDMLAVHSGIRLYRDGFRVKPYGDPGNDWTHREDRARAQAGVQPNDRTIGWVEISSEKNPQIIDTTTREKVIENEAFQDLVNFIDISIQKLNSIIVKRRKEKFSRKRDLPEQVDDVINDVNAADMSSENKKQLKNELNEIKKEAEQAKETEEVLMGQIEAYRNLASLGIMTGAVSHEIRQDLSQLLTTSEQLLELKQEINRLLSDHLLELNIIDLNERVNNIKEYMAMIRGYTSSLKSKSSNFRRKEVINFYEVVSKILQGFSGVFKRWDIQPINTVPTNLPEIAMFKADLQSILINFVSNSIKAIKSSVRKNAGQHFGNKNNGNAIKVSSHLDSNYFVFSVSDNGIGVHPDVRNSIFDMFVSYNEEEDSGESGSGLGLTIVKEIVESYGGIVFLDKPEFDEGATFTVKIPLASVRKN
jgi:signal transduction histidine kinase